MKSLDANNNERILKHGYLLKQSDLLKQWNLRYFVLSKECLCYYKTEEQSVEDVPKEVIFFNDMSLYIDELPEKQTKYCCCRGCFFFWLAWAFCFFLACRVQAGKGRQTFL